MKEEIKPHSHIKDALDKFIQHIESLYDSLPLTMMIVDLTKKSARNNFNDFLKEKNISKTSDNGSVSYQIKIEDFTKFKRLKKRLDSSFISERIIPESFFVSLISHYYAFLGDLIRALFIIRPEVLNSSKKKMAFSELLKFKSNEDAREFVIEKEIESVLRESHSAQFDWLENKFNIKLREDLPCWPKFIEITERRNLY